MIKQIILQAFEHFSSNHKSNYQFFHETQVLGSFFSVQHSKVAINSEEIFLAVKKCLQVGETRLVDSYLPSIKNKFVTMFYDLDKKSVFAWVQIFVI